MRQITMIEHKDGELSGEVLEDGKYWQIPVFEYSGKHKEAALLERLDIVQVEAQLEADMEGSEA
ncbi:MULTISPECIES: hypothetical protein [Psychrobacter]|uniref:hypothetical protein n=1 Tax=Psychrobacter TaxID=497 RepID=UPI001867B860|nr:MULTISPECIES: hypothetical protein [Psychrobacter]